MREISAGTKARIWLMVRDMHILIGLILGCVLLYFWLAGHWFARVVTFLACAATFGYVGLIFIPSGSGGGALMIEIALALTAAWLLSSIPTWLRKDRRPAPSASSRPARVA